MRHWMGIGLGLGLAALSSAGCTAEITDEDQALLDEEAAGEQAASDQTASSEAEEPIGESSEELTSCAVELVCANGRQLTVYEHSDCSGGRMYLCPGDYSDLRNFNQGLGWWANWNDRISILSTSSKAYAYAYSDVGFKGDVKYIGPGQWKNLGGTIWNDQISSIKVRGF